MEIDTSSNTRIYKTLRKHYQFYMNIVWHKIQYILKLYYNRTTDAFGRLHFLCITIKLNMLKYRKTSRLHAYLTNMGIKLAFFVLKYTYFLKVIHVHPKTADIMNDVMKTHCLCWSNSKCFNFVDFMTARKNILNHKYRYVARAMCFWFSHKNLITQKLFSCNNINHLVMVMEEQCVFYEEGTGPILYNVDKLNFVKH